LDNVDYKDNTDGIRQEGCLKKTWWDYDKEILQGVKFSIFPWHLHYNSAALLCSLW